MTDPAPPAHTSHVERRIAAELADDPAASTPPTRQPAPDLQWRHSGRGDEPDEIDQLLTPR